jgi:sugar phosphate isomerase/epimerase
MPLNRRQCLQRLAAAAALGTAARRAPAAETAKAAKGCTLSIGTYSLKGIPLEAAITLIADIGYDGLEIAVAPPFDGEPTQMTPDRRRSVREQLQARGLKLTALMENLSPAQADSRHKDQLDRLRHVVTLSRELNPQRPPLVQTVLGAGTWEDRKQLFRDRLGDWLAVFNDAQVVLAIKPHRGGAMSRPSEAIWLIEQLGQPARLKMVYDYSHYAFRDMPLEATVRESLPYTAHVAVKDAVQMDKTVVFRLPGESGTFDYAELFRLFTAGGYRGDFCCEVSAMVSNQPGYDPSAAAKICYANMARAFTQANVPRG